MVSNIVGANSLCQAGTTPGGGLLLMEQSPTGSVLRTLYGKTQIDSRTKRYRVAPQPVSPELPGCGGLVPLGTRTEQYVPWTSQAAAENTKHILRSQRREERTRRGGHSLCPSLGATSARTTSDEVVVCSSISMLCLSRPCSRSRTRESECRVLVRSVAREIL